MGIKPLYYRIHERTIRVASELRALALEQSDAPRVNLEAFIQYLTIGYAVAPATLIDGIVQLPHSSYAVWKNGELKTHRYADLAHEANRSHVSPNQTQSEGLKAEVSDLIQRAVRSQLVSDVPVGSFLSGGVDSSLVTRFAARDLPENGLQTFTMDFENKEYSEATQAARTAQALGTRHSRFETGVGEVMARWKEMAWKSDAPIFDASFFPMVLLCEKTADHVKVALSGDGGDELFLGYETYRADWMLRKLKTLGPLGRTLISPFNHVPVRFGKIHWTYKARVFARNYSRAAAQAHCGWREIIAEPMLLQLLNPSLKESALEFHPRKKFQEIYDRVAYADPLTAMSYVDLETWLPNDILVKTDRASMSTGLEVRVPLLDFALAGKMLSIPDHLKFKFRKPKALLKEILATELPSYPEKTRKRGFNAPISEWLASGLGNELRKKKVSQKFGRV